MLNANYTALWGALQSLGQLVGMLSLNPISDRIGRKMTLYALWVVLAGVCPLLDLCLDALTSQSLTLESLVKNPSEWAAAKFFAGMGIGAIQSTMPIYIFEWSPPNIRGASEFVYAVPTATLTVCSGHCLRVLEQCWRLSCAFTTLHYRYKRSAQLPDTNLYTVGVSRRHAAHFSVAP